MTVPIRREPYTLHGYTIRFHGYGMWNATRPDGSAVPVVPGSTQTYHKTYRNVVRAVKIDRNPGRFSR
jgi:hypothetical protein